MVKLICDVKIATMKSGQSPYGLVSDGIIAVDAGKIHWVGQAKNLPDNLANAPRQNFDGRLVTPALIDCHTHIVHGGNRAKEFEMRLNGASYAEISRAGGGIVATVGATRAESNAALLQSALKRVDALISQGVCTIEIKSGYGLDIETELKMLRVAREIGRLRPVTILSSFLAAHAVPAGQDADQYIDAVVLPALQQAHSQGLVDAVDGFCEGIAFDTSQIARVFDMAKSLGLPVKLHAEQLSNIGGAALAAQYGALSADHLEYASEADTRQMAKSGTVAVLLPGAFYTLREKQAPPIAAFRKHGVDMAVATDWNPGSSPLGSILLAMNMGCTLFSLTPAEALAGVTRNGAKALGLLDRGVIAVGNRADLAIWDVQDPAELAYGIAINPLHKRIFKGQFT
ncbi:MAG: imidazolonepropionase [Rhodobacteraceae bacterium]|nr:imidazolonepropionase [Paracoccaceae bacterium]